MAFGAVPKAAVTAVKLDAVFHRKHETAGQSNIYEACGNCTNTLFKASARQVARLLCAATKLTRSSFLESSGS